MSSRAYCRSYVTFSGKCLFAWIIKLLYCFDKFSLFTPTMSHILECSSYSFYANSGSPSDKYPNAL